MDKDERISVITFGCRLNAHESDVIKHYATTNSSEKKTFIINSCAVTAHAEKEARRTIRRLHRRYPDAEIIITGCASGNDTQKWASIEGVTRVVNNNDKLSPSHWTNKTASILSPVPSSHTRALIQIQQGCDHSCTFCIIPQRRGKAYSLDIEEIIKRSHILTDNHHTEIVLTGVDIASWHQEDQQIGTLCRTLLKENPNIKRLRLSSIDPIILYGTHTDHVLWDLIANEERFMPHLHLSLQAGSDLILKRMKRRHLTHDVYDLIHTCRQYRPNMGFGADIIAGFPTETNDLFQESYDFITKTEIPFLHVFPYSERPGTPAENMPPVAQEVRQKRAAKLREIGRKNKDNFLKRFIGEETDVLIENNNSGHTPEFAYISLNEETAPLTGKICKIKVTGKDEKGLTGSLIR